MDLGTYIAQCHPTGSSTPNLARNSSVPTQAQGKGSPSASVEPCQTSDEEKRRDTVAELGGAGRDITPPRGRSYRKTSSRRPTVSPLTPPREQGRISPEQPSGLPITRRRDSLDDEEEQPEARGEMMEGVQTEEFAERDDPRTELFGNYQF